jgi:hypothetical protein
MKMLYEHDSEEDFIEIHLTEKELKDILKDKPITKDFPAALNERRSLNIFIRRGANATKEE